MGADRDGDWAEDKANAIAGLVTNNREAESVRDSALAALREAKAQGKAELRARLANPDEALKEAVVDLIYGKQFDYRNRAKNTIVDICTALSRALSDRKGEGND